MCRSTLKYFCSCIRLLFLYAKILCTAFKKRFFQRISTFDRDGKLFYRLYIFIKFTVRAIFRTRDSTNHYLKSYLLTLSNGIHPLIRPFRSFWIVLCYLVPLILSLSFDTGSLSPLSYLCDFRAHVRHHNPNTNWIIIPPKGRRSTLKSYP